MNNSEKPVWNYFTFLHGSESTQIDPVGANTLFELTGGFAVTHDASFVETSNYIHYNPAPVFVPAPAGMITLMLGLALVSRRQRKP